MLTVVQREICKGQNTMKRFHFSFAVVVAALICATTTNASDWFENFENAKAKAAKEGKDLLLDFTGSDWCGPCIALKSEVFDSKVFEKEGSKHFVMVELDFPKLKELPESLKKQNEKLREYYRVNSFPTVVLADAKGRPYAKTGFLPGGPEEYLKNLAELRKQREKRDEMFAAAEKLKGVEKAAALDRVLDMLADFDLADLYTDVSKEIVELDPANAGGLKVKANSRMRMLEMRRLAAEGDLDGALKVVDEHLKQDKPTGELLLNVYFMKAQVQNGKGDAAGVLDSLEKAHKAAPDSEEGKRIAGIIQQLKDKKK